MNHKFQKKKVIAISASHTLNDMFSSFFAPLLPLLTEKLGFSLTTAGLMTVVQRSSSLLNPFFGLLADKLLIRWFLILSPAVTVVTMSLIGRASSVMALYLLMFVCGIAAAVYHTTAPVLMKQVSGKRTGAGMSFFMFGGELSRTLGPMAIMGAVSVWGLEGTWRLMPIGLTASIILYYQLRKLPDIRSEIHKKNSKDHSQSDIDELKNKESVISALGKMKPLFYIIAPMLLFRAFSKTALTTFLPSYLVNHGSTPVQAGMTLAYLEAIAAIATLASGILSDKIGKKVILVVIMALSPFLMYFFTITDGWLQMVLIGLMGAVFFASTPIFLAMVHDMNSSYPALANGMFMTVNFAMSSIVSVSVGYWGDKYGLQTTYQITAVLTILALPFALMIKSPK